MSIDALELCSYQSTSLVWWVFVSLCLGLIYWSRDSSVGSATGYGLDSRGLIPRRGRITFVDWWYVYVR
jgi:hypothetical protein